MKRLSILAIVVIIALAAMGVAYGLWSKTLFVNATVNTGTVDAAWDYVFTDDSNHVDNPALDAGDTGDTTPCPLPVGSTTSCDPKGPGPNALRYDKAVGNCSGWFTTADPTTLKLQIDNSYPSYYCTVWSAIANKGTIPLKVQHVKITTNFTNQIEGTFLDPSSLCGIQIDPSQKKDLSGWLHVKQEAAQGVAYSVVMEVQLVQWNEWTAEPTTCVEWH